MMRPLAEAVRVMRPLLGALVLATATTRIVHAQTCTAGYPGSCVVAGTATMTVAKVMSFSLSATSITAPTPTYGDYVQGYNETAGPLITIAANAPWSVSLSAATSLWTAQVVAGASPRLDKPAADLLWTRTPGSGYVPLSPVATALTSGTATTATTIPLYYRILYELDRDAPGTYTMDVVVTAVTP